MENKNKIAILTTVYNNYSIMNDFINSLKKQNNRNFYLFITDMSDKKEEINLDKIDHTILFSKNKGYACGINLGLYKAQEKGFEKFCIINNDVFFNNDFIEKLIKSLNSNPGSIIGGKIYYAPGYEYHKMRYQKKDLGRVIWYAGGINDWKNAITVHRGVDEIDNNKYQNFEKTDFITGALILFDKDIFNRVGELDEKYFLYYEDADWCERAKKKNINLYFDPGIIMWHKVAQSTGGSGSDIHVKYQERNRLRYGLKYAPFKTKVFLLRNYFFRNFEKSQ
jgi:GT2 family glycosyltransferase